MANPIIPINVQDPDKLTQDFGDWWDNQKYGGPRAGQTFNPWQYMGPLNDRKQQYYWDNPWRVVRWRTAQNSLPPGSEQPEWARPELENAYQLLKLRNHDLPWYMWQPLPDGDPAQEYLRSIPPPPDDLLVEGEEYFNQQAQAFYKQPGAVPQSAQIGAVNPYGIIDPTTLSPAEWERLPDWQRIMYSVMSSPELSGAMTMLPFAIAGGISGGIAGAAVGGVGAIPGAVLGFATPLVTGAVMGWMGDPQSEQWLKSVAGEKAGAALGKLGTGSLQLLNWPAEAVENTVGLAWQLGGAAHDPEKYGALDEVLNNLPEAFQAGRIRYESIPYLTTALGNVPAGIEYAIDKLLRGETDVRFAGLGQTHILGMAEPQETPSGMDWLIGMVNYRNELLRGDDPMQVFAKYKALYGFSGDITDLSIQMLADPLNFTPWVQRVAIGRVARAYQNVPLEMAARMARGEGALGTMRVYGDLLRAGYGPDVPTMTPYQRRIAGLTQSGVVVELQPGARYAVERGVLQVGQRAIENPFSPTTWLAGVTQLTPSSRARMLLGLAHENAGVLLDMAKDDPAQMIRLVRTWSQLPPVEAKAVADMLGLPEAVTVRQALAGFNDTLKELEGTWTAGTLRRTALLNLSDALGETPASVLDMLREGGKDTEGVRRRFIETIRARDRARGAALETDPRFTANELRAMGEWFEDQPYHPQHFRAILHNSLLEHVSKWSQMAYGVSPDAKFNRFLSGLKSVQSLLLLGFNPAYAINNKIGNTVHRVADGVFGLVSEKSIAKFFDDFGIQPYRLRAGVGAADYGGADIDPRLRTGAKTRELYEQGGYEAATMMGIARAENVLRVAQRGGDYVQGFQDATKKASSYGPVSHWAQGMERRDSAGAMYYGVRQAWSHLWHRGSAIPKINPGLARELNRIDPRLMGALQAAVEHGMKPGDLDAILGGTLVARTIDPFIPRVAEQMGMTQGQLREMLKNSGVWDKVEAQLKLGSTIQDAFAEAEDMIQRTIDQQLSRDIVTRAQATEARVRAEGFPATLDLFSEIQLKLEQLWTTHFAEWERTFELAYAPGVDGPTRKRLIRERMAVQDREWRGHQDWARGTWDGVLRGLGFTDPDSNQLSPMARRYAAGLVDIDSNWRKFYDDRTKLYRDFFDKIDANQDKAARAAAWYELQKQLNEMYNAAYINERQIVVSNAADFVQMWIGKYGAKRAAGAAEWVNGMVKLNDERHSMMDAFRAWERGEPLSEVTHPDVLALVSDRDPRNKSNVWPEFVRTLYLPKIAELVKASQDAARKMWADTNDLPTEPGTPTQQEPPPGGPAPEGEPQPARPEPEPETQPEETGPTAEELVRQMEELAKEADAQKAKLEKARKKAEWDASKEYINAGDLGPRSELADKNPDYPREFMDTYSEMIAYKAAWMYDLLPAGYAANVVAPKVDENGQLDYRDATKWNQNPVWYRDLYADYAEATGKELSRESVENALKRIIKDEQADAIKPNEIVMFWVKRKVFEEMQADPDTRVYIEMYDALNAMTKAASEGDIQKAADNFKIFHESEWGANTSEEQYDRILSGRYQEVFSAYLGMPYEPGEYTPPVDLTNLTDETRTEIEEVIETLQEQEKIEDARQEFSDTVDHHRDQASEDLPINPEDVYLPYDDIDAELSEFAGDLAEPEPPPTQQEPIHYRVESEADAVKMLQEVFGYDQERSELESKLMMAAAETWAKRNNKNVQEFWARLRARIGGDEGAVGEKLYQMPGARWYSQLERTIEKIPQQRMTAAQLIAAINKGGVKADELEWTGFREWIEGRESGAQVTKDEALEFVRTNRVQVEEVVKASKITTNRKVDVKENDDGYWIAKEAGNPEEVYSVERVDENNYNIYEVDPETGGEVDLITQVNDPFYIRQVISQNYLTRYGEKAAPARYETYTLPRPENYRELLFTLPGKPEIIAGGYDDVSGINWGHTVVEKTMYQSPHWLEPNVLAHVRFDERIGPDGERVLFVEEVQSDWHQAGREKGYERDFRTPEPKVRERDYGWAVEVEYDGQVIAHTSIVKRSYGDFIVDPPYQDTKLFSKYDQAIEFAKQATIERAQYVISKDVVPPAPFSRTWPDLVMKRMVRWAAENGYERIAWTTGQQQSKRYNLGNNYSNLTARYNPDFNSYDLEAMPLNGGEKIRSYGINAEDLPGQVGQDLARLIMDRATTRNWQAFEGEELFVGRAGMTTFYDRMLPEVVKKIGKRWGVYVGETEIRTKELPQMYQIRLPDGNLLMFENEPSLFTSVQSASRKAKDLGLPYNAKVEPTGPKYYETERVHSFDLPREMRESVMAEGLPLFQEAMGYYKRLPDGNSLVAALKNADVTTWLHESAHYYFDYALSAADLEVVRDFAGVEDLSGDNYRTAQEAFAEGYIQWRRHGFTPRTQRIKEIFINFRDYLQKVWSSLVGGQTGWKPSKTLDQNMETVYRRIFELDSWEMNVPEYYELHLQKKPEMTIEQAREEMKNYLAMRLDMDLPVGPRALDEFPELKDRIRGKLEEGKAVDIDTAAAGGDLPKATAILPKKQQSEPGSKSSADFLDKWGMLEHAFQDGFYAKITKTAMDDLSIQTYKRAGEKGEDLIYFTFWTRNIGMDQELVIDHEMIYAVWPDGTLHPYEYAYYNPMLGEVRRKPTQDKTITGQFGRLARDMHNNGYTTGKLERMEIDGVSLLPEPEPEVIAPAPPVEEPITPPTQAETPAWDYGDFATYSNRKVKIVGSIEVDPDDGTQRIKVKFLDADGNEEGIRYTADVSSLSKWEEPTPPQPEAPAPPTGQTEMFPGMGDQLVLKGQEGEESQFKPQGIPPELPGFEKTAPEMGESRPVPTSEDLGPLFGEQPKPVLGETEQVFKNFYDAIYAWGKRSLMLDERLTLGKLADLAGKTQDDVDRLWKQALVIASGKMGNKKLTKTQIDFQFRDGMYKELKRWEDDALARQRKAEEPAQQPEPEAPPTETEFYKGKTIEVGKKKLKDGSERIVLRRPGSDEAIDDTYENLDQANFIARWIDENSEGEYNRTTRDAAKQAWKEFRYNIPKAGEPRVLDMYDVFEHDGRRYQITEIEERWGGEYDVTASDLTGAYPISRLWPVKDLEAATGMKVKLPEAPAPVVNRKNLIDHVRSRLKESMDSGVDLKNREMEDLARQAGLNLEDGAEVNLLYDTIEGALNLLARDVRKTFMVGMDSARMLEDRILKLEKLEKLMPRARRTLEKMELQQFSTPLTLSEAAATAADVKPGDYISDDTAGTANLVDKFAERDDVKVLVNEIDPGRLEVLRKLGYDPTDIDVLSLRWTMNTELRPQGPNANVKIVNPPWGADANKYGKLNPIPVYLNDWSQRFAHQIDQRTAPGGRVVIVAPTNWVYTHDRRSGENTLNRSQYVKWIERNYTLRAIIEAPEGAYDERATGVSSLIVVYDKVKPEGKVVPVEAYADVRPDSWRAFSQLIKSIEPRKEGDIQRGQDAVIQGAKRITRPADGPDSTGLVDPAARTGEPSAGPDTIGRPRPEPDATRPGTEPGGRPRPTTPGTDRPAAGAGGRTDTPRRPGEQPESGAGGLHGRPETTDISRPGGEQLPDTGMVQGELGGISGGTRPATESEPGPAIEPAPRKSVEKLDTSTPAPPPRDIEASRQTVESAGGFTTYTPRSSQLVEAEYGYHQHPTLVVEAKSLAGVPYPELRKEYMPSRGVMEAYRNGALSTEGQLDAVWAAVQQNDLYKMGIMIADDVGMGKSRTAAAFVLDRIEKGKKRILVVTKNWENVENLRDREFPIVLGDYHHHTISGTKLAVSDVPIQTFNEPTVYFISATQFAAWEPKLERLNLDVLIADEVHAFKNIDGADIGRSWSDLHKQMLKQEDNNFLYLSATPGDDIVDLEFLYGLRVWTHDGFNDWLGVIQGRMSPDQLVRVRQAKAELDAWYKKINELERPILDKSLFGTEKLLKLGWDWFTAYEIVPNLYLATIKGKNYKNETIYTPKIIQDLPNRQIIIQEFGERERHDAVAAAIFAAAHPDDARQYGGKEIRDWYNEALKEAHEQYPRPLLDEETEALVNTLGGTDASDARRDKKDKRGGERRSAFTTTIPVLHTEQIMRELKHQGSYMSRDISRVGVEYDIAKIKLPAEDIQKYNHRVDVYRLLVDLFQKTYHIRSKSDRAKGLMYGVNGRIQEDAKRAMFDLRLKGSFAAIDEALANNEKVVISINSVSETDPKSGGHLHAAWKMIKDLAMSDLSDKEKDDNVDVSGLDDILFQLGEIQEGLEDMYLQSPVELLQKRYYGKIGFIVGEVPQSQRHAAMNSFQHDQSDVIVISDAGKTGINLHDITGKRRVHMVKTDYDWSAATFKQSLGRVDRTGQLSSPSITIMTTGNAVEMGFLATIANRLKGLGATSKGGSDSVTGGTFVEQFEFGGPADSAAAQNMWSSLPREDKQQFIDRYFWTSTSGGGKQWHEEIEATAQSLNKIKLAFQQMHIEDANRISAELDRHRQAAREGVEEYRKEHHKMGAGKKSRVFDLKDNLKLTEVWDSSGYRYGILSGILTPWMKDIANVLGKEAVDELTTAEQRARSLNAFLQGSNESWREWIRFQDTESGEFISGLVVRPKKIKRTLAHFGQDVRYTRESLSADLEAGERVPILGEGLGEWDLRKGQAGGKAGFILVEGAKMKNQDALLANGASYHPTGLFWYVKESNIDKFLKRFPIREKLSDNKPDTLYQMGPDGRPEPTQEAADYAARAVPDNEYSVMWMPRDLQVGRHYIRGLVFRQGKFVAYVPERFATMRVVDTPTGKVRILGIDGDERWVVARERNNWEPETLPMQGEEVEPQAILANGTVDAVSGIEYDSQTNQDAMSTWLRPAMDNLKREMVSDPEMFEGKLGQRVNDLPVDAKRELKSWINTSKQEMSKAKLAAIRFGERKRDFSLLNYSKRYGFDNGLNAIYPYQFWYTRSMINWMQRVVDRPYWASWYARMIDFMTTYEDENRPSRLRNKIRIPAPYLPEWAGGGLWVDPMSKLFPFAQFSQPVDMFMQQRDRNQAKMETILQEMVDLGKATQEDAEAALKTKKGPVYEQARALAEQENSTQDALDYMSIFTSPAMYLTYPYQALKGRMDKTQPLPLSRQLQAAGALLDMPGLTTLDLEAQLRKRKGLSEFGQWGDYYIDRQLANMTAEGLLTSDQAIQAMVERKGEAFEQAVQRVKIEMALKTPMSSTIAAGKQGNIPGMLGSMLFGYLPATIFPDGELELRGLKGEWNAAREAYNRGDPEAMKEFFANNPEYEARLALYDTPDEKLKQFLISQVWDKYAALPDLSKKEARAQMGRVFNEQFLDSDTRDYDTLNPQTLAMWSRALGGWSPEGTADQGLTFSNEGITRLYQDYQDQRKKQWPDLFEMQQRYFAGETQLEQYLQPYWTWRDQYLADHPELIKLVTSEESSLAGADETTAALVYQFRATRAQMFPDIFNIQDAYFDKRSSEAKRSYLKKHPELQAYWEWMRGVMQQQPEIIPFIKSTESIARAVLGDDYIDFGGEAGGNPLTQQEVMQYIPPALMRTLYGYYFAGDDLGAGSLATLSAAWKKLGKPGKSLQEWVEGDLRQTFQSGPQQQPYQAPFTK